MTTRLVSLQSDSLKYLEPHQYEEVKAEKSAQNVQNGRWLEVGTRSGRDAGRENHCSQPGPWLQSSMALWNMKIFVLAKLPPGAGE